MSSTQQSPSGCSPEPSSLHSTGSRQSDLFYYAGLCSGRCHPLLYDIEASALLLSAHTYGLLLAWPTRSLASSKGVGSATPRFQWAQHM